MQHNILIKKDTLINNAYSLFLTLIDLQ